ncbi:YciI family protein [Virgisporangium ochraceum]|uniref:Transcription initiation protein n=1 Tax=Virgisporangium ochraceum TaxID=65505 RepID=A0A8J3ZPD8_9ACTN|nr:YciI family protein [Virgisporangium ochraceum]GIJ65805.1 transcription initiation protein [Virgisporangium ochraceum]
MRYMLWMIGDGREEPSPSQIFADPEFIAYEKALEERGIPHRGGRLRPPHTAVTVRVRNGEVLLTDGPFADTKEHIGGYEIIEVPDLDVAIEVAALHPAAHQTVEIRPFLTDTDTGNTAGNTADEEA